MCKNVLSNDERQSLLEFFSDGFIAFDLETTGLSPMVDRIIEFAAIKVLPDKDEESLEQLINPEVPIPPVTTQIHNITDEMVKDSPTIHDFFAQLREFIGDLPLIAHNASFDAGFILGAQNRVEKTGLKNPIYDSLKLARNFVRDTPNHRLSTLVKRFEVELLSHHRALDDTKALLKIIGRTFNEHISEGTALDSVHKKFFLYSLESFKLDQQKDKNRVSEQLIDAVKTRKVLEIDYKSKNPDSPSLRPVKPFSLLFLPKGGAIYGLCLLSGMFKSFALSKVRSYKILEGSQKETWDGKAKEIEVLKS